MKISLPVPKEVSRITKTLENAGFEAFIVGGCVRDSLMNREPKDWDITTKATPSEIEALFTKTFYENRFGTVTIVNEDTDDPTLKNVEVTPYRTESEYTDHRHPDQVHFAESIEDDLARRDFTINALAYNLDKGQLIDLFGGVADIKDKIIKTVGSPTERFREDALRLLRAVRLATELGFSIDPVTEQAIEAEAGLLGRISKERLREEFNKIIMSKRPMMGLQLISKLELLPHVLPDLVPAIGTEQNGDHIFDVWEHSLRALQHAAERDFPLHLRLAALFHDIGKPATRRWIKEKNDWTFYGHEVVGARLVQKIMADLKYPSKTAEVVEKLVRNHMFFVDVDQITLSAVRRIIAKVGENNVWDLMKLRTSDRIGMGRPKEHPYRLRKYESMIEEALRSPTSVTMLKIDGNDLMNELHVKPGPQIGQILHALLEEVLDEPTQNTKEYLLNRAKDLNELGDKELAKLAAQGKEKKSETENKELKKIRQRHGVK
ncbi:MAG: hypothetical protein A2589_00560 [Candidatus Vogelbacteria bacterium RIFOXYD1_FULL_46_19]|uniref:HD/PDEase domain-containing protein n=1 Tax=Candidatus Vogelbacteria bacterium RIFOXYD1_FULL_46_19 TaxID=1802439 RepID=A0A1G2QI68_9BACT|nr:MAG: hypothetical protein A2589_00560 [Candidatus Vogelbacteria bacterium RIFOXYD1_FULL_46_19]